MKQVLPYIVISFITLILSIAIVGGIAYLKPHVSSASKEKKAADTTAKEQPKSPPTAEIAAKVPVENKTIAVDNIRPSNTWADTVKLLRNQLNAGKQEIANLEQQLKDQLKQQSSAEDSVKTRRRVQFAKLVESMNAESAAKVLNNMEDQEVKSILLNVKARQASKILAALEPRRAARLMN